MTGSFSEYSSWISDVDDFWGLEPSIDGYRVGWSILRGDEFGQCKDGPFTDGYGAIRPVVVLPQSCLSH